MIKKLLSIGAFAFATTAINAQITIFEDSFENYQDFAVTGIGDWTMRDMDGKRSYGINGVTFPNGGSTLKAFQVMNKTGLVPAPAENANQFTSKSGAKHLICWNVSESPLVNNDWMISPKIKLGADGNKLSFWVKPTHEDYGVEKFNVLISTTDTEIASFTSISFDGEMTNPVVEWVEYEYDLDEFKGQDVYIAIQCVSDDQFALQVDDFKVTATSLSTNEIQGKVVSVYPNPTTDILNISTKSKISDVEIYDMAGKKVSNPTVNQGKVDVRSLVKGSYVLKINTDKGVVTQKFIKK